MKKLLAILLLVCIAFSLCACKGKYERELERAQESYDVQSGITEQMIDDYNDLQSDIDSIQEQQRALGID